MSIFLVQKWLSLISRIGGYIPTLRYFWQCWEDKELFPLVFPLGRRKKIHPLQSIWTVEKCWWPISIAVMCIWWFLLFPSLLLDYFLCDDFKNSALSGRSRKRNWELQDCSWTFFTKNFTNLCLLPKSISIL